MQTVYIHKLSRHVKTFPFPFNDSTELGLLFSYKYKGKYCNGMQNDIISSSCLQYV